MINNIEIQKNLSEEIIRKILSASTDSKDATLNLYRYVFDDWDSIRVITGYPEISEETGKFILDNFVYNFAETDKYPGGIWINIGFSTKPYIEDFVVHYNGKVEYEGGVA